MGFQISKNSKKGLSVLAAPSKSFWALVSASKKTTHSYRYGKSSPMPVINVNVPKNIIEKCNTQTKNTTFLPT